MKINILVVEDESSVRNNLSYFINQLGEPYQLIGSAMNGEQAIQLSQQHRPHIIITDIRMPKMDGFELITEMKAVNVETKFIIISGYDDFKYARKAIQLGVEDYLLKPIRSDDLEEILLKVSSTFHKGIDSGYLERWDLNLIKLESKLFEAIELGNRVEAHNALAKLFEGFLSKVENDPFKLIKFIVGTLKSLRKRVSSIDMVQNYFDEEGKRYFSRLNPHLTVIEMEEELKEFVDFCINTVKECRKQSCPDVLYHCKKVVDNYYSQNITLGVVAEVVGVTSSYLSRTFKKEYNMNFTEYLTNIRIQKAKELLCDSQLKIHEIAERVGFNNAEYFTRIFKKNTGLSPTEFRMKRIEYYEEIR